MNKKEVIDLGDTVKCRYTGFIGVATSKTEFINGCIQYGIVPKWKKDERAPEEVGIDSDSLVVIKKSKRIEKENDYNNGGSMRKAPVQRGY